jgi:hypothetical protein
MSRTLRSNNSEFRKEQIGLNTSVQRPAFSNPPLMARLTLARGMAAITLLARNKEVRFKHVTDFRGRRYIPGLHISDWLPRQSLRELESTIEKLWRDFLQQNGD